MRLSADELSQILSRKGYHQADTSGIQLSPALAAKLCDPLPESNAREEPLVAYEDEEGSAGRITVRITRFGAKLLDADNLAGGVKPILDALRYEKLIPEDNPRAIRLVVAQQKAPKGKRGTLVEIGR